MDETYSMHGVDGKCIKCVYLFKFVGRGKEDFVTFMNSYDNFPNLFCFQLLFDIFHLQ
jgi:hypothetical protein